MGKPPNKRKINLILETREIVLKALEISRRNGFINSSLEAKVILYSSNQNITETLNYYSKDLWEFFIVSQVELKELSENITYQENQTKVLITKAEGQKCERCWIYSPTVGTNKDHPTICSKCIEAIS